MRSNQVTIRIDRFGKYVPKGYPADVQRIEVYCDDFNSIYAALSKAYALAINELAEYENIGVRTDVYTNEFSKEDYHEMRGALSKTKRKYEDDFNVQYYDTNQQLCEDHIWVYENAESILEVLRTCEDVDVVAAKLKDRFGLNDYQIRKLSQMRFDMLTKQEYLEAKQKVEVNKSSITNEEKRALHRNMKKRKVQQEIAKLKAYFVFVENYQEIMSMMVEMDSTHQLESALQEKFGFSREQAKAFKYYGLNEFSKEAQEIKREELQRLEERLAVCYTD